MQKIIIFRRLISSIIFAAFLGVFYLYFIKIGIGTQSILILFSLLLFVNQAFALPAGILGDRLGAGRMMVLGCIFDAFSYLILSVTESKFLLVFGMIGIGVGGCLFSTNARAVLTFIYQDKSRAIMLQGSFLRATNLGTLLGSLIALFFIAQQSYVFLLLVCSALEFLLSVFMLINLRKFTYSNKSLNRNSILRTIIGVFDYRFIKIHLFAMIPFALCASFPIIFPYLFSTLLHMPEQFAIAQFLNAILLIALQQFMSRWLIHSLEYMAYIFIGCLIVVTVFLTLVVNYPSLMFSYVYLVIFTVSESIVVTQLTNALVGVSKEYNKGTVYGSSKLIMALTTPIIINLLSILINQHT